MRVEKKGFTLVEILIVVVILGILAAIVIPQFTDASTEARVAALASDLQTVRSQIELYKIQHLDQLPPTTSFAAFETAMTTQGADGFGPYIVKIPSNAFATANQNVVEFGTTSIAAGLAGDGDPGWILNTTTGKFQANDNDSNHCAL